MACKELPAGGHRDRLPQVYLLRHGETEWAVAGRHTGRTDIPLTENGRQQAMEAARHFSVTSRVVRTDRIARVIISPLQRARQTWEGLREAHNRTCRDEPGGVPLLLEAEEDPDLQEWDYGAYEGMTTTEIRKAAPGWTVFTHGCPEGESPEDVGRRCDRVIAKLRACGGRGHVEGEECVHVDAKECFADVAVVAHGHLLRALAARWLELAPSAGRLLALDTATLCVLGYDHDRAEPVIRGWNALP